MHDSTRINSISYLKANAAQVLADLSVHREPLLITQNGEAKAVLQDVASYVQAQETLALLQVLALGNQDLAAGRVKPVAQVLTQLRAKCAARGRCLDGRLGVWSPARLVARGSAGVRHGLSRNHLRQPRSQCPDAERARVFASGFVRRADRAPGPRWPRGDQSQPPRHGFCGGGRRRWRDYRGHHHAHRCIGGHTRVSTAEHAMERGTIDRAIAQALQEATAQGISGKASTPFLLARVNELTGGDSLTSNIALVLNNARLASAIALAYAALR